MSRKEYLAAVLDEVEKYPRERAALIISLDRRMEASVAQECVELAIELKNAGRSVVGLDLCGDPMVSVVFAHYLTISEADALDSFYPT